MDTVYLFMTKTNLIEQQTN